MKNLLFITLIFLISCSEECIEPTTQDSVFGVYYKKDVANDDGNPLAYKLTIEQDTVTFLHDHENIYLMWRGGAPDIKGDSVNFVVEVPTDIEGIIMQQVFKLKKGGDLLVGTSKRRRKDLSASWAKETAIFLKQQ